jgi:hypothetical protein
MRTSTLRHSIFALAMVSAVTTAIAAGAAAAPGEPAVRAEQFTGSLVNIERGAHFSQPFVLYVDHYATEAEVQRLTDVLTAKGPFSLRDEMWKNQAGYLSIGGGIGLPVGAVFSQATPDGRIVRVLLNRRLGNFEVQNYTRSSKYLFTVLELHLDKNGRGDGLLVGDAKMRLSGDTLTVTSLGDLPVRLLAVRTD